MGQRPAWWPATTDGSSLPRLQRKGAHNFDSDAGHALRALFVCGRGREVHLTAYERYRIPSENAPNLAGHPSRFRVDVSKPGLAGLLLKEIVHYRGNVPVIVSRPCVYGVFSGPVGGFAPREHMCVGCLRCTVQYPDIVEIRPNPERARLGDSYLSPNQVDTILYEASTGRVPVRGAGYRGAYGGDGWDGMWTDMSEIVRPTRDGIHGREYISTSVDIGPRPMMLELDAAGEPQGELHTISLPIPFVFDPPPDTVGERRYLHSLIGAAEAVSTLVVLPLETVLVLELEGDHVVPLVRTDDQDRLEGLEREPPMFEIEGADPSLLAALEEKFPNSLLCLRIGYDEEILPLVEAGHRLFHLIADYHGMTGDEFVLDAIRRVHESLVSAGVRQEVTLLGSGGIAAAEHLPKAIIAGLDMVAVDTPALVAVQGQFDGEVRERTTAQVTLPSFSPDWGRQRLVNLAASWRDQLLEVLGAMGLREVRRLRGETGRAMFERDLEREAFAGIDGYPHG